VLTAFPTWFTPHDPAAEIYTPGAAVSWSHLLGTTSFGQDVFSQVIAGTRQSVMIALIVGFFCTVISVIVGISAAYMGGIVDDGLSLLTDVVLVIPTSVDHRDRRVPQERRFLADGVRARFHRWSYGARQLRVQALSLRNRDYLLAAKARGESSWYVITVELIPPMTSLIVAISSAPRSTPCSRRPDCSSSDSATSMPIVGHDVVLGAEQRGPANGTSAMGVGPRRRDRDPRPAARAAQLRFDEVANPALRPVRAMKKRRVA